jgi:hypothetical protein
LIGNGNGKKKNVDGSSDISEMFHPANQRKIKKKNKNGKRESYDSGTVNTSHASANKKVAKKESHESEASHEIVKKNGKVVKNPHYKKKR